MSKRVTAVTAWESLFRAQVAVMRTLQSEFPTKDLSFNEYDVLLGVSRQPDREIALKDLNQHVLLTQPSVSRLVDRLVARGLVSKCPEPGDGRASRIRMTEQGYAVFRAVAIEHMRAIESHVGGALPMEDLEQLAELSDRLRNGLADPDVAGADH
jgi:DNA-binding MarR family transcriptional regulator